MGHHHHRSIFSKLGHKAKHGLNDISKLGKSAAAIGEVGLEIGSVIAPEALQPELKAAHEGLERVKHVSSAADHTRNLLKGRDIMGNAITSSQFTRQPFTGNVNVPSSGIAQELYQPITQISQASRNRVSSNNLINRYENNFSGPVHRKKGKIN